MSAGVDEEPNGYKIQAQDNLNHAFGSPSGITFAAQHGDIHYLLSNNCL